MSMKAADFSSLPPETAQAMAELTDAVVRDYVRYLLYMEQLLLPLH